MHGVPTVLSSSSHDHRRSPFRAAARPTPRSLAVLCLLPLVVLALYVATVYAPLSSRLAARHARTEKGGPAAAAAGTGGAATVSADEGAASPASRPSLLPLPLAVDRAREQQLSSGSGSSNGAAEVADAMGAQVQGSDTAAADTAAHHSTPWTAAIAAAPASAVAPETPASTLLTAAAYVANVPWECNMEGSTDYDGDALTWGLDFHTASAAECCARCLAMSGSADADAAGGGASGQQRCNIWVFCPEPGGCWSPDIWDHKHRECWLKHGVPPKMTFQGRYAAEFRAIHPTAPEAVQWVAGVV